MGRDGITYRNKLKMMNEKMITVKQLQEKLNKNERLFILDVRPLEQRNEWKTSTLEPGAK